jgi:hypothetical protein
MLRDDEYVSDRMASPRRSSDRAIEREDLYARSDRDVGYMRPRASRDDGRYGDEDRYAGRSGRDQDYFASDSRTGRFDRDERSMRGGASYDRDDNGRWGASSRDADEYWSRDSHADGRPAGRGRDWHARDIEDDRNYGSGRATNRTAGRWNEDEDRRYLEDERSFSGGRRRTVFDAGDEMDRPGLEDDRDVFSGRDRGIPTHEEARYGRDRDDGRDGRSSGRDTRGRR